jgi:hypothetical protein
MAIDGGVEEGLSAELHTRPNRDCFSGPERQGMQKKLCPFVLATATSQDEHKGHQDAR